MALDTSCIHVMYLSFLGLYIVTHHSLLLYGHEKPGNSAKHLLLCSYEEIKANDMRKLSQNFTSFLWHKIKNNVNYEELLTLLPGQSLVFLLRTIQKDCVCRTSP